LLGGLFLPKLIESLILAKPPSRSPNFLFRTHLARHTRRMPNTRTAAHPSTMPAICALVNCTAPSAAAGLAVAVAAEEAAEEVPVGDAVVAAGTVPVGRLTVGIGVAVVVPGLMTVRRVDGTRRGPDPEEGRIRVATMVECVLGSALDTPTHMLYPVWVASAAAR
jgi:hypothetical protein